MQLTIFDAIRSEEAKRRGIDLAEKNQLAGVELARVFAREIAERKGTVNADDVAMVFEQKGIPWIGNAAGSIFRKGFVWTGNLVKSARVHAHSNLLREWRLKDA